MQTMQLVNNYLAACQTNGASPGTIAAKQSVLGRFALDCPELPPEHPPIIKFLASICKSPASRKTARKHIRAFYTFLCQQYRPLLRQE